MCLVCQTDRFGPGDPWTNPLDSAAERSFQSWNPANYQGWTTENYNLYFAFDDTPVAGTNLTARDYLTADANLSKLEVDSKVLVYQGYFWDGAIVGTYGYRKDEATSNRF